MGSAEPEKDGKRTVFCSICLDPVTFGGDRSAAKLQCGHEFHLDCIGSAFNAKGVMQCPNCHKTEQGGWFYANGSHPLSDLNFDERHHDEDLYDVSFSEMPHGVHWCPYGRISPVLPLYEDVESSPSVAVQDIWGHHDFYAEHIALSEAAHPCPYVAYLQPLQASSSSNSDAPTYNDQWSRLPRPEVQPLQSVHPVDFHYNHWAQFSHSYSRPNINNGVADQPAASFGSMRAATLGSEGRSRNRTHVHPLFLGHGSGSGLRTSGSFVPLPQYARSHGNIGEHYYPNPPIMYNGTQRSAGSRPLGAIGPPPESTPLCLFPPAPSSSGSADSGDTGGNHLYAWERDRLAPYPLLPADRETSWWALSSHSLPNSEHQRLFWQRSAFERPSAQSRSQGLPYRSMHVPPRI